MKLHVVINMDQRPRRTLCRKATANFWCDVLLLGVLCATMFTAFVSPRLHIWLGIVLIPVINIHLFLHWRLLAAVLKGDGLQWKRLLNVVTLMAFVSTVLSGIIVALIYAPNIADFHSVSVVIFSKLVVIHLYTNRKWIARQFKWFWFQQIKQGVQ